MLKAVTKVEQAAETADQTLPIGATLSDGQFTITGHLGAGGFGKTYRADDNVLGRAIVIKECFPEDFCYRDGLNVAARNTSYDSAFRSIVDMFMREARSLAKLRHPNIVGVHRAFEENETAYMALDLIDGSDLLGILQAGETTLSPSRVKSILTQLLDAIEKVHEMDLLHRDISPDNIIIEQTGAPVLIDFGAARGDASRRTRAISSLLVVKDGYSPQEFYVAGSEQAPSSDLYALAATFYHVLSGEAPPHSQSRMVEIAGRRPDPCVPLAGRIDGYEPEFLGAIDAAMAIHPGDRLQSAAKWKSLIDGLGDKVTSQAQFPSAEAGAALSLDFERTLSRLVEETNDEVRRSQSLPAEPEPEPVPIQEPSQPAWIEEFNEESLAPKTSAADCSLDEGFAEFEKNISYSDPFGLLGAPGAQSKPRKASEINWIHRAFEKQERLLAEREILEAIDYPEPEPKWRITSLLTRPFWKDQVN
ncbi:MAG: serine/threonine-protein kinase [Paracoccaceae bacterium]|nr:serine/threonine-protein kinase [Paracoccaceae bacterium]